MAEETFTVVPKLGNLKLGKVLGEGSSGTVRLAIDSKTGEEFAVKVYDKSKLTSESLARVFFEAEIMKNLPHKNIVQFKEVVEDTDKVYIIMKYAKNGDLLDYVRSKKKLTEEEARVIFLQIFEALNYAHNQSIIHRDIKLENILLDENNDIIIGDWGFADFWSIGKKIKCAWGSLFYAAPEVFTGAEYTGPEIDIWSLGVVLYAITCGKLPFSGIDNAQIAKNIVDGAFKVPNFCSKSLASLLSSMMRVEPLHRINMKEIRTHPWILANSPVNSSKSIVFSDEEVVGTVLQRENKKSAIASFFNKLINPKTSSKEQLTRNRRSKVERKEKRMSVVIPDTPQPAQNKRWSIGIGPIKFTLEREIEDIGIKA